MIVRFARWTLKLRREAKNWGVASYAPLRPITAAEMAHDPRDAGSNEVQPAPEQCDAQP